MLFAVGFLLFLFGLCIGSFLNVVVYRLEKNKSFITGRSYCPHCKHQLVWRDLVPVFSWVFLKGKCRYCHKKISVQYPIVEIITGLLFLLIFNFQFPIINQFSILQCINLLFLFYVAGSLIVIFVYDLKYYLIPDKILFPAILMTFFYRIFENSLGIENYFLAALIASGFFLAIFLVSKGRWMGFGDVKLAILLGLLLGFPQILVGLFLSFLFGAIIGLGLLYFQKKGLKSEIPFGPFLITGTFAAMLFGSQILQWYMNMLLF